MVPVRWQSLICWAGIHLALAFHFSVGLPPPSVGLPWEDHPLFFYFEVNFKFCN